MKKYIYGSILAAAAVACFIFFVKPPETGDRVPPWALSITFRFSEGYEFTAGAPFVLTWRTESPEGILSVPVPDKKFNPLVSPYKLVVTPSPGSEAVVLNARLYYCHKVSRMCFQDDFEKRVLLSSGAAQPVSLVWEITPKKQSL